MPITAITIMLFINHSVNLTKKRTCGANYDQAQWCPAI